MGIGTAGVYGTKKLAGKAMYGTFGGINQSSKTSVNRTRDLSRALSFGKINDAKEGTRRLDQLFAKNQDAFGIKGPKSAGALKAELGDDAFKKLTQAIGESGKVHFCIQI